MPTPWSPSCSRSLLHDKSCSCDVSPAGPSSGKCCRGCSLSERHYIRQREESPGPWNTHLFLSLIWHENHCLECNDYAMPLGGGAVASRNGFRAVVEGLIDHATVFSGRESSNDLIAQVDCLCCQCDDLKHELSVTCKEITCLSWGIPQPSLSNNKACQLERARLASLGVPMEVDPHDTGSS
jgi:hypothetical protein